jgi:hypothetical protein
MTKKFVPRPIFTNKLLTPPEWAIDNFVPEAGITCLLGKPGSYKTFGAIGIAGCKASGLEFCGRWVGPPCKVLYIAADSPQGVELRIQGWIKAHRGILEEMGILDKDQPDLPFPNLLLLEKAVNLTKPLEVDEAIKDITELSIRAEVLTVDTLFHSSVGADLKLPEELLPLLEQLRRLMEAVGAKTCVLVHHTTKDRDEFYGSISGIATVAAIIRFDRENDTTATVTCVRVREGAPFDPFEIVLTKQTVKTLPDKRGRAEFEVLVTTASAHTEKKPLKEVRDLSQMEFILERLLKNKATRTAWMKAMQNQTSSKDGKGGWSEATFDRRLNKLKTQGRVSSTGDLNKPQQGDEYSVAYTEQAKANRAKAYGTTSTTATGNGKDSQTEKQPSPKAPSPHPLKGDEGDEGTFLGAASTLKHPHERNEGGSRESRTGENSVVETDLEKAARDQLNATKH